MSAWQKIRAARTDLTDYVVHLTRFVVDRDDGKKDVAKGFTRLKRIIKAGHLRPSYAPRETLQGNRNQTVRGLHKAVCFTAQPLEQIPVTLRYGTAYEGYGIALNKVDLYKYGGRPVIYGDEAILESLNDDLKYQWVRYRPIKPGEGYPNDFTFEREWRGRVCHELYFPWKHALKGLPLLLPEDFKRVAKLSVSEKWLFKKTRFPDFRFIVRWDMEVKELREFIDDAAAIRKKSGYLRIYHTALRKAQIISLEHVERKIERGNDHYRRIEDLPTPDERLDIAPKKPKPRTRRFLRNKVPAAH